MCATTGEWSLEDNLQEELVLSFHHVEVPGIELGSLGLPPTHLADPNFFLESGCHVAQANSELTM